MQGAGPAVGQLWTELQEDSLGPGPESSARGGIPASFLQAVAALQAPVLLPPPQQQQQQSALGSGTTGAPPGGDTGPMSSPAASNSGSIASASLPASLSMGSMPRWATGAGGGAVTGAFAALEDAVGHAVSRRLSRVEGRLAAVMERLEGFLDAADPSSGK